MKLLVNSNALRWSSGCNCTKNNKPKYISKADRLKLAPEAHQDPAARQAALLFPLAGSLTMTQAVRTAAIASISIIAAGS